MQKKEKVLDDLARIAGGTVSVLSGLRQQVKQDLRTRLEEMAMRLDLVPREDFERLETMLTAAREEQEELKLRVEKLEKAAAVKKPAKFPAKKTKTGKAKK